MEEGFTSVDMDSSFLSEAPDLLMRNQCFFLEQRLLEMVNLSDRNSKSQISNKFQIGNLNVSNKMVENGVSFSSGVCWDGSTLLTEIPNLKSQTNSKLETSMFQTTRPKTGCFFLEQRLLKMASLSDRNSKPQISNKFQIGNLNVSNVS